MDDHLTVIAQVVAAAVRAGVPVWLRGGWAMDFFLGAVTRDHDDVDWFCWAVDADRLEAALLAAGLTPDLAHPRDDLGRDYLAGRVELQIRYLGRNVDGAVVVPGDGPYAGSLWPAGMLDHPPGRIGELTAPIISPEAQIEIKTMMPVWVLGMPVRDKDQRDIATIRAALG
jgi:Aminoglycoside-2''-adenylyltransferase